MAARDVGGTTDRNSLSARQANGAAMLVEVDAAAVAKLLLVWFIAEIREEVGSLLVRNEVEQPQVVEGAFPHCFLRLAHRCGTLCNLRGIPQHVRRRLRDLCHLSRWHAWCVRNTGIQMSK